MSAVSNPGRTPVFRFITIASSGLGSLMLGIWGLKFGFGDGVAGMPAAVVGAIIVSLCALAAAGAAMSFFAGIDESASYVFNETHFDKLTGLLTRPAMVATIGRAAQETMKTGDPVFLIDIDIDRFKQINDSIGYSKGDELIRAFTRRLKSSLPEGLAVGRIGAGEFAVLYPDASFAISMEEIAENLIDELMKPYDLLANQQSVNVSVGIVAMPKDGVDPVAPAPSFQSRASKCESKRHRELVRLPSRYRQGCRLPAVDRIRTPHRFRARRFRSALSAAVRLC